MPGSHDSSTVPSADVFKAVRALGIMDSTTISGMARPAAPPPPAPEDPSFRVFGRDVFARSTTQFDPAASGPVDDNYILGPGDQLVVVLTGDIEASYSPPVTRDGFIVFTNLGTPMFVEGHSVRDVRAQLFARLGKAYSGLKPDNKGTTQMLFTVAKRGVIQVRVAGDVTHPGLYDVSNSSTIIAGLYQAGGPTDEGSMRAVQLKRGSQTVGTMDLYDYLTTGNTNSDLIVLSNDVIFVPTRGPRVRITGAVMRPMTYELKPGETLRDVVKLAGGFTPAADRRRLQIARVLPPPSGRSPVVIAVIRDIMDPSLDTGFGPATELEPDDVIIVGSVDAHTAGQVVVHGNVWSGGSVAFAPGMRLSEALRRAGGLKSDTYLAQVNISRLQPDSTRVLIRAALRDTLGNSANDLPLAENDEIDVFSVTSFRPNRFVAITGAVRKNGQYPYREGMTLRDLALEAGGLTEGALLTHAEIARLPADRTNGTRATTIIVPLDSLYLFERGPDGKYLGPPGIQGAARSPEVVLQPYDYVLINNQPDWTLQETVAVEGEVLLPGIYAIKSKNERIRDFIARAGGLEPGAYANGVTLSRKGLGRIGIDLPAVLRDSTSVDNLLVVDGDQIFIPPLLGGRHRARGGVLAGQRSVYQRGPRGVLHPRGWGLHPQGGPQPGLCNPGKRQSRGNPAGVVLSP